MVLYIVNNYDNNNNQSYEFISGDPKITGGAIAPPAPL